MSTPSFSFCRHWFIVGILLMWDGSLLAAVPDTFWTSSPPPAAGPQTGALMGSVVVMSDGFCVAAAYSDDTGAMDSGVVKVFNQATGALMFTIPNPTPAPSENFGRALAISGTRLVVGCPFDGTGASSAGSVYVYDLASGTPTVPLHTINNPAPAAGDSFGLAVGISDSWVVVGAYGDDAAASNAGSAYLYHIDSGTPTTPIYTPTDPSPSLGGGFGIAVAISGNRVVVGANGKNTGAVNSGAAYVYDIATSPTAAMVSISNPSPAANEAFGNAMAIDGAQLVIGCTQDSTGATAAGTAYVYNLASGTPGTPVLTINNPTPATSDRFAFSVAVRGTWVLIGGYGDDTGATDGGSAYLYNVAGGTPTTPVATINNPAPAPSDSFGIGVALTDFYLCVGAQLDDTVTLDAGAAYLYETGPPPVLAQTMTHASLASGDEHGHSIALAGRYLAVGAWLDNQGVKDAGAVQIHDLGSATPGVPMLTLLNPAPVLNDSFGAALAVAGTRIIVGDHLDDATATNGGTVFVFDLASGTPGTPVLTINNPAPSVGDNFGSAVAASGSLVVVAAVADDAGAFDAGSVYAYDLAGATPSVPVLTLANPAPSSTDNFGSALALEGSTLVVGAVGEDVGATNAGLAYVYDLAGATPGTPVFTINNPAPAASDGFGNAVAISGTRVLIAASADDAGATNAGTVYVYDLASGTPTAPVLTLNNPAAALSDAFGNALALSGTTAAVGCASDDDTAADAGRVFVFDLGSGTPGTPAAIVQRPTPVAGDQFGYAVALSGTRLAVGAPLDDSVAVDKGGAYLFGISTDKDGDGLRDAWELTHWPTIHGHNAEDDADHDGQVELLELAFGLNPLVPNGTSVPAFTLEGGYLTMTITKQPGAAYEVQSAGTLPGPFSAATTTILQNDASTLKARDNFPTTTTAARFLRVQVTAIP
ncbi:MAG: hypothetical protein U1F81_12365 [Verrucomicrobiaceae bacterium]